MSNKGRETFGREEEEEHQGEEEEKTFTIGEIVDCLELEEREALRLQRLAERGAKCTYPEGYVKLQQIFACLTCYEKSNQYVAICRDCALMCHKDHHVEDLYNKRDLRCDCGNGRSSIDMICKLYPKKDFENCRNKYNHNFGAKYCYCDNSYDPDSDNMIKCLNCEDWFHISHIDQEYASLFDENQTFFICKECTSCSIVFKLLSHYQNTITNCQALPDTICFNQLRNEFENSEIHNKRDFILLEDIKDKICSCDVCRDLMLNENCEFILLDDDIEDSFTEDDDQKLQQPQELISDMLSKLLPEDVVKSISEDLGEKTRNLANYLKNLCKDDPSKVITEKDICYFFEENDSAF